MSSDDTKADAPAGPVERGVRPRAWQWLDTGILRKQLPATAESGAWTPLYDQVSLDAAVAAERARWKAVAIEACNRAGDGPENGCCPTYWEEAREACITAIQKANVPAKPVREGSA